MFSMELQLIPDDKIYKVSEKLYQFWLISFCLHLVNKSYMVTRGHLSFIAIPLNRNNMK